ncbi:MAG: 50S ribosomal protein L13 [Candidatus Hydrothermarchaeota archaeon]
MEVIDAKNLIVGRLATHVAKRLLRGESVTVVNAEEGIISGSRTYILAKYLHRRERKSIVNPARHGPFFPRRPEAILRRAVRGMLPYEKARGREAYKRLKVFLGVPEELKGAAAETVVEADASKLRVPKYMKLGELSQLMGAKL